MCPDFSFQSRLTLDQIGKFGVILVREVFKLDVDLGFGRLHCASERVTNGRESG